MDVLFKLDKKEFTSIQEAKNFFHKGLLSRDMYFYSGKRMAQLESEDNIYFSLSGTIVAKATFADNIIENKNRDGFKTGHKIRNIQIIDSTLKISSQLIKGRSINYLNTDYKINEINRVLNYSKIVYPDEVEYEPLKEGAKKKVIVNAYERSPEAREKCIDKYGYNCSICEFNFEKVYGEIGRGFIHVHHLKSLHEIDDEYEVDPIKDLRPVCPNCHAMLHKRKPAYTIEEIKSLIKR